LALDGSAPQRLGVGTVLAFGDGHVLLGECDEVLDCGAFLIAVDGSERREVNIPDLEDILSFGYSGQSALVPNGDRLALVSPGIDGSDRLRVVNLLTDEVEFTSFFEYSNSGANRVRWSRDGTLVFYSARGLQLWRPGWDEPETVDIGATVTAMDLMDHL
jgi:hypothetical protein